MRSAVVLAFVAFSCTKPSVWPELDSIEDLRAAFERDSGKPRIVLLLSPT